MDASTVSRPMAGLGIGTIAGQIPDLVRHLPDQLARIAAQLHALDATPLAAAARRPRHVIPVHDRRLRRGTDRPRRRSAAPRSPRPAVASSRPNRARGAGDHPRRPPPLQPPRDRRRPELIDWTVARIAHPGFTVGFTHLMLANPPIPLPTVGAAMLRPVGRNIARRFLSTYRTLTDGTPAAVDDENLGWHRQVHALRILVELAAWDAADTRPTSGHPWLILEPVAYRELRLTRR